MRNQIAYSTFCVLLISFTAWGQKQGSNASVGITSEHSYTRVAVQRNIKMERDSKSEEVILDVDEDVERFELIIRSSVSAGKLKIELYDPQGNKKGAFSVGTQLNSPKLELVNGNINKTLKDPQSGDWKVNIVPTQATGTVTVETSFFY